MLKHGLIDSESHWGELVSFDFERNSEERIVNSENSWWMELQRMVEKSVAVKQRIVTEDPTEQGIRKALNLGHTAGHAFDTLWPTDWCASFT